MNTKRIWRILILAIVMLTLTASPVSAEEPLDNPEYQYCGQRNQAHLRRGRNNCRYNLKKIETLRGKVIRLKKQTSRVGNFQGIHFLMETPRETIEVHTGPSWYLAEQDFDLSSKGEVMVVGSRINIDGKEAIIARKIKKGDRTLTLRDKNGFPVWRGCQQSF